MFVRINTGMKFLLMAGSHGSKAPEAPILDQGQWRFFTMFSRFVTWQIRRLNPNLFNLVSSNAKGQATVKDMEEQVRHIFFLLLVAIPLIFLGILTMPHNDEFFPMGCGAFLGGIISLIYATTHGRTFIADSWYGLVPSLGYTAEGDMTTSAQLKRVKSADVATLKKRAHEALKRKATIVLELEAVDRFSKERHFNYYADWIEADLSRARRELNRLFDLHRDWCLLSADQKAIFADAKELAGSI